ncbi:MAG: 30S ribosomal protein S27e [Candidatus Bathyarchaeota archaeon]
MSEWKNLMQKPRSRFLRVKCSYCSNEQTIFNSATTLVKCNVCDSVLAEPTGGKAKIRGEILGTLD